MGSNLRIRSIDVLRGIAVAIMIIGDNPGNSNRIYIQLKHPLWNGLTVADFAFPLFILTMCMTIPIVMEKKLALNQTMAITFNVIKKSFILILLGLFLNGFPLFNFTTIRIPGVLQRLGVVYLIVSLFYLVIRSILKKKVIIISFMVITGFLIVIWYYFLLEPFSFGMKSNLVNMIDVRYLSGHIYTKTFDPEGILSTIGAVATGIFGCSLGYIITLNTKYDYFKLLCISLLGGMCILFAYQFNKIFPFNKQLWSSSFILVVAGYAALGLSVIYLICDIFKKDKIFIPFIALGSSPIFVYMITELISKSMWKIKVIDDIGKVSLTLPIWITTKCITPWAGARLDSLYFSIVYLILWMFITTRLYSDNKFIKI